MAVLFKPLNSTELKSTGGEFQTKSNKMFNYSQIKETQRILSFSM